MSTTIDKNLFKSVGAILAGVLTIIVLSTLTDTILEKIGFFPPPTKGLFDQKLLLIALFYRTIFAFLGGYVTAKLAPSRPVRLVIILLVIGTVMGILGVIAGWNLSQHWYPISLVLTSFAGVWIGGKSGIKKTRLITIRRK